MHCTEIDLFQLTQSYLLESYTIIFPCDIHSSGIVKITNTQVFIMYKCECGSIVLCKLTTKTFVKKEKIK